MKNNKEQIRENIIRSEDLKGLLGVVIQVGPWRLEDMTKCFTVNMNLTLFEMTTHAEIPVSGKYFPDTGNQWIV